MSELDRYVPGVPCWVDTTQPDPEAAVEFYRGLFGWELDDMMPPDGPGRYYMARIDGADVGAVSSLPEGAPPVATWNTYVWVDSADETAAKARKAGGSVLAEPMDVFSSGRMAVLADIEGAAFSVWEANEHRGATLVNAPGSVNFNDLYTRDPATAKSFYGAVFGWGVLALSDEYQGWTLPGYGQHLERLRPGTLAAQADMGAPEGFVHVVASLNLLSDDQPDAPPHWGVTFAVDDADATAKQAKALGGTVVVPPFDAPWVRATVITDPQGATFTAAKFVPENDGG